MVIGTSHFRCQSAQEVSKLIQDVKPDGVVVELDPERAIRLTLQDTIDEEEQWFGADFLAAIQTAQELDIPLFIGDEYAQETKSRLIQTMFSPNTYDPKFLLKLLFRPPSPNNVDIFRTFLDDPLKVAPLAVLIVPPFFCFIWTLQSFQVTDIGEDFSLILSVLGSFLATSKVFNTLIADRDPILAANAIRAARVVQSLKEKKTIRKRWTFPVNNTITTAENGEGNELPLFTLKRPLEPSKKRNLNLFEPRWLKMIDRLPYYANSNITTDNSTALPISSGRFGCVTCTNKFYSAIDIDGVEGRYADVIFNRKGRIAELINLQEGQRPSGARKVLVEIEGKESFQVDEGKFISANQDGYLVMASSNGECQDSDMRVKSSEETSTDSKKITILVVVGLLHANGVIDYLSNEECRATER